MNAYNMSIVLWNSNQTRTRNGESIYSRRSLNACNRSPHVAQIPNFDCSIIRPRYDLLFVKITAHDCLCVALKLENLKTCSKYINAEIFFLGYLKYRYGMYGFPEIPKSKSGIHTTSCYKSLTASNMSEF